MRGAFIRTLAEIAERDSRVLLLTGDLGYMAVEPFSERFPDRFFNVGVAEQNLIGLATGLAEAGFVPFCYSIAVFASLRGYEFIRNGPVHQQLPVRVVGIGGGFEYGPAGPSHHALEDTGVMRIQPGLTVVAPADYQQAAAALTQTWALPGPIYFRLGKDDKTTVAGLDGRFQLGRAQRIRDGADLLFVSTGSITREVVGAAEILAERGIQSSIVVVSSFNPSPEADLVNALSSFATALTVEAHYINGGLGSLVSEIVAARRLGCRIVRCGVTASPARTSGSEDYLNQVEGISRQALVERAILALAEAEG